MIRILFRALLGYDQPALPYCPNCGGHYPPGHFPCG